MLCNMFGTFNLIYRNDQTTIPKIKLWQNHGISVFEIPRKGKKDLAGDPHVIFVLD